MYQRDSYLVFLTNIIYLGIYGIQERYSRKLGSMFAFSAPYPQCPWKVYIGLSLLSWQLFIQLRPIGMLLRWMGTSWCFACGFYLLTLLL